MPPPLVDHADGVLKLQDRPRISNEFGLGWRALKVNSGVGLQMKEPISEPTDARTELELFLPER